MKTQTKVQPISNFLIFLWYYNGILSLYGLFILRYVIKCMLE